MCCQLTPEARQRGFTLLELLVVMALLALAVGMAAPAAMRGLDAARERGVRSDMDALLSGLPVQAFRSGRALKLDSEALRALLPDMPADWQVRVSPELAYGPGGMAAPAEVELLAPGRPALRWRIQALSGEVSRLP